MSNENNDPSKQVLVWDCSGDKKFKMPIGELYDKVGTLRQFASAFQGLTENIQDARTSKRSQYLRRVA
jgi:hypothetical protein